MLGIPGGEPAELGEHVTGDAVPDDADIGDTGLIGGCIGDGGLLVTGDKTSGGVEPVSSGQITCIPLRNRFPYLAIVQVFMPVYVPRNRGDLAAPPS